MKPSGDEKEDRVLCICGKDSKFGEMASCEICAGWFHFQCLGYKENVGLLDDRSFVCCFCMASKTVSLMREVEQLRKEVQELRGKLAGKEEESDLDEKNAQHGDRVKHPSEATVHQSEASFSKVVKRKKKPGKASTPTSQVPQQQEKTCSPEPERSEKRKVGKQSVEVKGRQLSQECSASSKPEKKLVARRKLWGTKRVTTEEVVKAYLVSRVPEAEPLEVSRVFKSEEGRYRWWFWLVGDECVLELVDEGNFGEYWKVERISPRISSGANVESLGARQGVV